MGDEGGEPDLRGGHFYGAGYDADEAQSEKTLAATKDAVIFLIDAGAGMLAPSSFAQPPDWPSSLPFRSLDVALYLVQSAMRHKIASGESKDNLGVVFFGTRETKHPFQKESEGVVTNEGFDGVFVLQEPTQVEPLAPPSVRRILQVKGLSDSFEAELGSGSAEKETALRHALWICEDLMMKALAGKPNSAAEKTVVLLTNDGRPLAAGSSGQTVVERKNLLQLSLGGYVQVLPLAPTFDWAFYSRIHGPDAPPGPGEAGEGASLASLLHSVRRRTHKKRRLCALELTCSPGLPAGLPASRDAAAMRIATDLYSLVKRAKPPSTLMVTRLEHAPLKTKPGMVQDQGASALRSLHDRTLVVRKAYAVGSGPPLLLTAAEAAEARAGPGAPGVALLGFAPLAGDAGAGLVGLREADNAAASHFLYPSDAAAPGSGAAFAALHDAMRRRAVFGLALLTRAQRSAPKLVALLPAAEQLDKESGCQTQPPGLHVIYLPYADDARANEGVTLADPPLHAPAAAVAAAQRLVRALRLRDFRCDDFSNPDVLLFQRCLEHYALVADDPVEDAVGPGAVEDQTLPAEADFAEHGAAELAVALVAAVAAELPEEEAAAAKGKGGGKRKAPADEGEAAARAEEDVERAAKVARLHAEGKELGAAVTVDDLKGFLRQAGLKVSGTKPQLLARVAEHLDGGGQQA